MTTKELIEKLQELDPEGTKIVVYSSRNDWESIESASIDLSVNGEYFGHKAVTLWP